jgi:hypothetical protein
MKRRTYFGYIQWFFCWWMLFSGVNATAFGRRTDGQLSRFAANGGVLHPGTYTCEAAISLS